MKKPRFFDDIIAGKPDGSYLPYGRKLFRIDKFLHFQFAVGSGRHCITAEKAAAEISRIIESDFIGDLRDVQRTGPGSSAA